MNSKDYQKKTEESLQKWGYEAPETYNVSHAHNPYMSYSENSDEPYINTNNGSVYGTYGSCYQDEGKKTNENIDDCPVCQAKVYAVCDCKLKDRGCSNGHIWYIEKGVKIIGDPH